LSGGQETPTFAADEHALRLAEERHLAGLEVGHRVALGELRRRRGIAEV
jgi:hypothetical protein